MNIIAMRAAAFVVGSMIAGCVYTSNNSSAHADAASFGQVAIYPAARHTSGNIDGDRADVSVHTPFVTLRFRAARYDSNDAPARVIAFYRKALAKVGTVSEKRGGPHSVIQGFRWESHPDQTTLAAGHTIVAVEPRGSGTVFALIDINPEVSGDQSGR